MTLPAAVNIMGAAAVLALTVIVGSLRRTQEEGVARAVAVIALGAITYALCDVWTTLPAPREVLLATARVGMSGLTVAVVGWLLYLPAIEARPLSRVERAHALVLLALAVACLVPRLVIADEVGQHHVHFLGVTWTDTRPTVFGNVVYAALAATMLVQIAQCLQRYRRTGAARDLFDSLGLAVLTACGVNDSLVSSGVVDGPYLIGVALFGVVAVAVGPPVARFVESARQLERLSLHLGQIADDRARELVATREQLVRAERLASVGRLSAGVAHEVNNPTAAVLANLLYLRDALKETGRLPDDAREALSDTATSIRRVASIVRQFLEACRLANAGTGSPAPVDVSQGVGRALLQLEAGLPRSVTVRRDLAPGLHALGHEGFFEQMVANLVSNAAQAMETGGGEVVVRSRRVGAWVEVEVIDHGPGISEAARAHLFEPFFTTRPGRGTGLGLSISRNLAQSLGGDISLRATSREGTTIVLRLPWTEPAVETQLQEAAGPRPGRLRVLVVDDEPLVGAALKRVLAGRADAELADSPAAALERLARGDDFDVVLCDVMMPGGGGRRVLEELRARFPHLVPRTIFLTGGATTAEARDFLAGLPNTVLEKPVEVAALHEALEAVRGRRPDGAGGGAP